MKLNLGCQIHYFDGWVNQDVVGDDANMKVDLVCDAVKLPYEDASVDFIYAGHLVEHFYPDTLPAAIAEWKRVLKPGGKLVIVTPDCGSIMRDYASGKLTMEHTWQQLYGRIYHYDRESERHHIAFDHTSLAKFLIPNFIGGSIFVGIDGRVIGQYMDFANPPAELVPFMGEHISTAGYQIGFIFTK